MSLTLEEQESHLKLARLRCAFEKKLDVKLVEEILKLPGNINHQISSGDPYEGYTALHFSEMCSKADELKVVQLLLVYGADFTVKNAGDSTVVHKVLDNLEYGFVKYDKFWGLSSKVYFDIADVILLSHLEKCIANNPANKYGFTHFHVACMTDHAPAVQFFLENGVDINLTVHTDAPVFSGCTPLLIAAKSCAVKVVKVLLQYGANPSEKNEEGVSVVHWIIECNIEIFDSLIIEQVEVDRETWLSKIKINQRILDLVLNSNNVNSCNLSDEIGLSNLQISCMLENVSMITNLLHRESAINHQVHVNSKLGPGFTAMHFAAHFNLDIVKLLLSKGADMMIKCQVASTPFDICLERYGVKDIHTLMVTQPNWKDITMIDGRTKLLDLVFALQNINEFRAFLDQHVDDINTSVHESSPLWPGYTVLHLVVLLSEQPKNISQYGPYPVISSTGIRNAIKFIPNLQLIEECLSRGANVSAVDISGRTPLHLAFFNRQSLTIEMLLQFHHSPVNQVDFWNLSQLHIACASQNQDVVRNLIQSGAEVQLDVYSQYKYYRRYANSNRLDVITVNCGSSPLHVAVACGDPTIIRLLVDSGADVNATDIHGSTPIHCLLFQGSDTEDEISRILFSSNNLKEVVAGDSGITHLHVASYNNQDNAVKRLLDLGANIDARLGSQSALDNFKDFYCNGVSPPSNFECYAELTPLQVHVLRGPSYVANLLISRGADFLTKTPHGECALHIIFDRQESLDCVETLINLLSDNEDLAKRVEEKWGLTILHLASSFYDLDLVKKLIEDGAGTNVQLNGQAQKLAGCTPLHFVVKMSEAYMFGQGNYCTSDNIIVVTFIRDTLETTRLLLAANADITTCDTEGNTPLHVLVNSCPRQHQFEAELLNIMLNTTTDFCVNPVNKAGWSHFHIACYLNNTEIIEKFLKHGVDVNVPIDFFYNREGGSSPLHLVVRKPFENMAPLKIETIDALLLHGAQVNTQNAQGDTVLHRIASFASDRVDIVERLFRAEADLAKLNIKGETPFATLLSAKKATPEVIGFFIQNGCLVNNFNAVHQRGYLSLPLCINNSVPQDRVNIFQVIFKSPDIANVDAVGRTPIHNIVSAYGFDISDDVSVEEYSLLIKQLCEMGCDIDFQDQSGRTALHLASQFKNIKAIRALLRNGSDLNIIDNTGSTAFTYSFDVCECNKVDREHIHANVIKTFYIHVRKLKFFKLSVNEINRTMMAKANNSPMNFDPNEMEGFYREANYVTTLTYKEESNSISLDDLLSETRIVSMYPHKPLVRAIVDKFYQSMDVYLGENTEIIGLVKLQFRKAMKRVTLAHPATESLIQLVRFPFPETCSLVLFKFLSNLDLENLILATNDPLRLVIDE